MTSRRYFAIGVCCIASAAFLWVAAPALAQKGGGGHGGGGGHSGGGSGYGGGGGAGRSFSGTASRGGSPSAARSYSSGFSGSYSRYPGAYGSRSNYYRPYYRHYYPGFFGAYGFYDPWFYSFYYPSFIGPWYPLGMTYGSSVAQLHPYLSDTLGEPPPLADDNMVHLRLKVPAGVADVWFENQKTEQTGAQRDFDSPSLTPGKTYTYDVRVRWSDNGREKTDTRKLYVRAGERLLIDFTQPPPPERLTMPKAHD
jgi:uncharacterized protein (TIGR03000 family)